ncbi:PAS domain S-box protein [Hydrogenophaga sp. PAMC20947]|nr:PAS domain S-box protein [Hydrogenophaga sp. PAMC20947]
MGLSPGASFSVPSLPFEAIFDASPLPGSVARQSDGLMLAVNDAWVALMGLSRDQVIGRKTSEFEFWVHPEDRSRYLAELPKTHSHHLVRLRAGQIHRVRLHSTVMDIEGVPCLVVFMGDVKKEYEAEVALEAAHRALQHRVELLEASEKLARMGHWTNTDESSTVEWSAGMYAIGGLEPKQTLSRLEGRSGIHPDDLAAWVVAREASDNRELEFRWLHPDGGTRWFRTRMGRTHFATRERSNFGVIQDITAEREAVERLEAQLALMRNLTAHVPAVLFQGRMHGDGHNEISFVNDAVLDLLELEPADLLIKGAHIFSHIHAPDRVPFFDALRLATDRLSPLHQLLRVDLPVKGQRWIRLMMAPTQDAAGTVLWHGFMTDVSDSVGASQALERQHRMLEAVRQSQAVFIESKDRRQAFEGLLESLVTVTDSEYGFVGEVFRDDLGQPYFKTHAITNIARDDASQRLSAEQQAGGMEFRSSDTLFGHALLTGETVISNDPVHDPRSGGFSLGHLPLKAFLGVPIHIGDEMVAMVGLANKPRGYSEQDVRFLQPLLGTVRQLVMAWRDEVQRQRTSEALEATTDLLREKSSVLEDTLESINQGLAKIDGSGRLVAYNQRFLELLDLPETLMASHPSPEAILRFQRDRGDFGPEQSFIDTPDRSFIENLKPQGAPDLYLRRTLDGRTLEFHSRTTSDGGIVRTCSDVSSYIAVQEALRSERQRLEWVLEATRPGIWETDQLTGAMTINERWAEMLGYTVEELAPVTFKTWTGLLHPDELGRAMEIHRAHCAQEIPYFECDLRMRHKAGHWVSVNTRGRVHRRDSEGKALFMSGTHMDITDRVTAQEEVRALNAGLELRVAQRTADLESTLKDMEAISYSIAHDLRAPLRAVNGFASVIAEGDLGAWDPSSRDMFERIVRSSRTMGQMLTDMLSLLQVVRADLVPVPVDMGKVARSAIDALVEDGSRVCVVLQELPSAQGDAGLLRQVLFNLVDNAVKYSRQQATPTVWIGHDPARQAYFVRDNGMGFDMAHAGKLFGLFQRLHASSDVPGMGVGLAIVARIIERHGGRIWAESKPDAGATFWWTLPPLGR